MKLFPYIFPALLCCIAASQAIALSVDDKTMNTENGTPHFIDPDDKTPSVVNLQGSAKIEGGKVDTSATRYDYDPASGTYIQHQQ
jgi:hypothetical protein